MNMSALLTPRIRDEESLQEFFEALTEQVPNIERYVAKLRRSPRDKVLIADLFRALHNIKGDASLCRIDFAGMIVHPIESLLERLRNGELAFSDLLAEAILLAVDKLALATESLNNGQTTLGHLKLLALVNGFEDLAKSPANKIDQKVVQLIEAVTGFRPVSAKQAVTLHITAPVVTNSVRDSADLDFFRSLALQYETLSALFKGRSERQVQLALETNEVARNPVDPSQLKAAVYMHDLGMLFLPESRWLKASKLTDEEKLLLQEHPGFGGGLLQRMEGWKLASTIVLQHHEMHAGGGYPHGLKGDQITPGAKILAVIDTFEAVTLKHKQHGGYRSLIRAIAEINACDKQFEPKWIAAFNTVVRRMVER